MRRLTIRVAVDLFSQSLVMDCLAFKLDHRPIIVQPWRANNGLRGDRPFCFQAAWISHETFPEVVKESGKNGYSWKEGSKRFIRNTSPWNRNIFGNIFKCKCVILNRLKGIDHHMSLNPDADFTELKVGL